MNVQIGALQDLALTVKRTMICIFGDQDMSDGPLGRQAAFNEVSWGRCLRDTFRAGPAGHIWAAPSRSPEPVPG